MLPDAIVDPHHHLLNLPNLRYPWIQDEPPPPSVCGDARVFRAPYLVQDFRADFLPLNITKSVHVEAGAADSLAETRWLQNLADTQNCPTATVAHAALDSPNLSSVLEELCTFSTVRGIRHIITWHADPALTYVTRSDYLEDPAWLAGFKLLDRFKLSFDLQVYPSQLLGAVNLAKQFPSTVIILDHTGMPVDRTDAGLSVWRDGMRTLAAQDNVFVKLSGLGMVDHKWTVASMRQFILYTIDCFGPQRCMFASNFPVDRLYSSYQELYDAFDMITEAFSPAERLALFSTTASTVYRI